MRFTRYILPAMFTGTMLLAPASAPAAASKEMQDLQRDMADLQQQVKDLQKADAAGIAALQSMIQQELAKTNNTVSGLNTGIAQTLQNGLRSMTDQLSSVTGLSTRVSGIAEDVSNLQNSFRDMQVQSNKQGQMLVEILNQIKLLQAPPAPPPSADGGSPGASLPPPSPQSLFTNAVRDHDAGKHEMAISEFKEFLRLYPDDVNAIRAQYNMGDSYYSLSKLDDAVDAFDAVIERYPKNEDTTPNAEYMKGMALKAQKKNTAALATFKALVHDFPHSQEAPQAQTQIRQLGGITAPPTTARKPR